MVSSLPERLNIFGEGLKPQLDDHVFVSLLVTLFVKFILTSSASAPLFHPTVLSDGASPTDGLAAKRQFFCLSNSTNWDLFDERSV